MYFYQVYQGHVRMPTVPGLLRVKREAQPLRGWLRKESIPDFIRCIVSAEGRG